MGKVGVRLAGFGHFLLNKSVESAYNGCKNGIGDYIYIYIYTVFYGGAQGLGFGRVRGLFTNENCSILRYSKSGENATIWRNPGNWNGQGAVTTACCHCLSPAHLLSFSHAPKNNQKLRFVACLRSV